MRSDKFCVFILSHGRPDNVKTVKTLKKQGYTGDWYIVIDDEDECGQEYVLNFGKDHVVVFSKSEIAKEFDQADHSEDRRTIVYARNACFDLAKKIGYRYFVELDDDYTSFEYRYIDEGKLCVHKAKNIDAVFSYFVEFLRKTNADTVAMAQGGDLIGGVSNANYHKGLLRKAMNSFFCDAERPFKFIGRINEDVNTYVALGCVGKLFLTYSKFALVQTATQKSAGGMSGVYRDNGTFLKSFYTVMMAPSCVDIREMGDKHKRLHHNINWNNAVPKIIREAHKMIR